MYIACRQMKISLPPENKGERPAVAVVEPGEVVPGAETWDYLNLTSHVSLGHMRWQGEGPAPHEPAGFRQPVRMPEIFRKMAPKPVAKHTQEQGSAGKPPAPAVTTSASAPPLLHCPHCPGSAFRTARGLKSHTELKHPKDAETQKAG